MLGTAGRVSIVSSVLLLLMPLSASAEVDFVKQIKPLLQKHCVSCHDESNQESGLRLDFGEFVLKGGDRGPTVVAGKSDDSWLIKALTGKGGVKAMPLDQPRLSDAEIKLLKEWIDAGAKSAADDKAEKKLRRASTHWSFQPLTRPPLPTVKDANWPQNAIDHFVLAKLEAEGLKPSPEADRATLLRRASLDLLGIPPTPEQLEMFVSDTAPGAYERMIDRLLASPRYGERWGRHWLDMARYADSNGFTIDGPRSIWPFRDWVIQALNADLPYSDFATHQLAGDLLPQATREHLVATGFHRNTLINQEGGTDQEQFRNEAVVDRVNTTGAVFLGLTVGCAQCHLHKYDPITQREFYQLFAFFNNCDEPNIPLPSEVQAAEQARVKAALAEISKELKQHDTQHAKDQPVWEKSYTQLSLPDWKPFKPQTMVSQAGASITTDDGERLVIGGNGNVPATDVYTLTSDIEGRLTAVRLEAMVNQILPNQGPGWTPDGNFIMTEFQLSLTVPGEAKAKPLAIDRAFADWSQEGYSIEQTLDNNRKSGWSIAGTKKGSMNTPREALFVLKDPIDAAPGSKLTIVMKFEHSTEKALLGYWRLATTGTAADKTLPLKSLLDLLAKPADQRTEGDAEVLSFAYGRTDESRKPLEAKQVQLKREEADLIAAIPTTMILQEKSKAPRQTYIHVRGDFLNKGADVTPGVPAAMPPLDVVEGRQPNRLDFCRWLFEPSHPLTSRVTVNRFWQQFFGSGLVETENDLGTQGAPPTHPALLDWIAAEFSGLGRPANSERWSLKSIHRLMLTSATYRQSSQVTPELLRRDPYNRLLGRQKRVRLEAEQIRDAALTASGLLSQKLHGPGVYPPQPKGIYVVTQVAKAWPESQGDDRYRRGLYTYFWRSSPYPMLPTFDAPDANGVCTRRNRSNTPLQALTLANDGAFLELARAFSDRILREASASDEIRASLAFRAALGRSPSANEVSRLLAFVEAQRTAFSKDAKLAEQAASPQRTAQVDAVTSATWTAVARVLLNVDEFITRE